MQRLLIQGCSEAKLATPKAPIWAIDRYDGPFFRVIRKWSRETDDGNTQILILSGKFGLIDSKTRIPYYDLRLTQDVAKAMCEAVMRQYRALARGRAYESAFVNVGRDYHPALAKISELRNAEFASGGIGMRAKQLKLWLVKGK